MLAQIDRRAIRRRVRYRIRRKISGTAERPRLAVYRSQKHIYVQAIDDVAGRTIAHASTQGQATVSKIPKAWNIEAATHVGTVIAEKLKALGVYSVLLDRGGYVFHGRVKAIAEAAREAGLKF
jgi:large subunit ribosomal protein L18